MTSSWSLILQLGIRCSQSRSCRRNEPKSATLKRSFLKLEILTDSSVFCYLLLTSSLCFDSFTSQSLEDRSKSISLFFTAITVLIVLFFYVLCSFGTNCIDKYGFIEWQCEYIDGFYFAHCEMMAALGGEIRHICHVNCGLWQVDNARIIKCIQHKKGITAYLEFVNSALVPGLSLGVGGVQQPGRGFDHPPPI